MATNNLASNKDDGKSPLIGLYRARIENNIDPMKLGRVQARVPQFHGLPDSVNSLKIGELPWSFPCTPNGTGYDHGTMIIPDIGDYVFLMFENGDRNSPVYLGGCYGRTTNSKPYGKLDNGPSNSNLYNGGSWNSPASSHEIPKEVYSDDQPTGKVIYKSPKGATIWVEEADGKESIQIIDRIGQIIKMSSPVKPMYNANNVYQRKGASADKEDAYDPSDICVDGQSEILIKDASNQEFRMIAKGTDSRIQLKATDGVTKLILKSGEVSIISDKVIVEGDIDVEGSIYASDDVITKI
jgi:hypothetical protein